MFKAKLMLIGLLSLSFISCSKFESKNSEAPAAPTEPAAGGSVVLRWHGPDHPEDFDKFGGITGYHIHWSTSPVDINMTTACGTIIDEHGRPDDKYSFRVQVLGTSSACQPRITHQNSPDSPRYGTTTYAHECTYKVTGLPQDIPLYFTISAFMGDPDQINTQWWGCPMKEFTLTATSK